MSPVMNELRRSAPSRRRPREVSFGQIIKQVARREHGTAGLSEEDAYALFSAMLDGGIPDLELGALLAALRVKGESPAELLTFHRAMSERLYALQAPAGRLRPLVIPAYGGARGEHNLLPLLGLLLRRLGVPVLFHGTLEGSGRVACVYILRELGIMPSATLAQAEKGLDEELLAFVPVAALCPGLASLLALRNRLGVRNSAHTVAKLIEPFEGQGVRMASASSSEQLDLLAAFLATSGLPALLLRSTEGEPFADPRRRPKIEWFEQGERHVLFEEEAGPVKPLAGLPASIDAHATAAWIKQALAGEMPIPHPLVNQLACCLYVCGYTEDMNQAKAIAAVETGSLGPAGRRPHPNDPTRAVPR
jgi:anthranilate phosphoribosyltransferase